MSAVLTLGKPEHLEKLFTMVTSYHSEAGITLSDEARLAGVAPLLEGIPHGIVYLIGPPRSPIGYIIITFGWSLELGGMDGTINEFYVRSGVRGRGVATETLQKLPKALGDAGLVALHLQLNNVDNTNRRLFTRVGFAVRENHHVMTRKF